MGTEERVRTAPTGSGDTYDAVVIGSGMGGLTVASLLARLAGRRVLVLERHFKLGGYTHTFRRGRWQWDVGVHYVGEMGEGSPVRAVCDLVTDGQVGWTRMPDPLERFVYPDLVFDLAADPARSRADLVRAFPHERGAIARYFRDLRRVTRWTGLVGMAQALPSPLGRAVALLARRGERLALETTGAYRHYSGGGYYPAGGAGRLAAGAMPVIARAGGAGLVNTTATAILVEDGAAVGVRAIERRGSEGRERVFRAPVVVSDAGALATYLDLLPAAYGERVRADVEALGEGLGTVTLYLGLHASPATLGFRGENHWLFAGYDHDALFARQDELVDGVVTVAYLSFPSLKNPEAPAHTAEIVAPLRAETLREWRGQPWRRRGADYAAVKARMADALLDAVEARYPGFRRLVAYQELSTPLTTEHFTGHRGGAIYGLPAVPARYRLRWLGPRTPIRGLYLTGADAVGHGIAGALMGGVLTAGLLLGPTGVVRVFTAARRFRRARGAPAPRR